MKIRIVALVLAGTTAVAAADWPQFRGSLGRGVATGAKLPVPLGLDQPAAWRADLPGRGVSGPVVLGDRVFVTASSGPRQDRLHVLAFGARDGKKLWQRTFWATGPTDSNPKTCMAAPTPVAAGGRVVALFATDDLVCLDLDGNVRWIRSLYGENPGATDGRGLASSPVIVGGKVIVQAENQNTSFATAIDVETGADVWRVDRPRGYSWSSPFPLPGRTEADALLLFQTQSRLSAIDAATGREVWGMEQASGGIASGVTDGKLLVVPGFRGLRAFELQPGGAPPKPLWEAPRLSPGMASPILLGNRVYVARGPFLVCGDLKTGKVLGQVRLQGTVTATPVSAGGLLYCASESGEVQVLKPREKEPAVVERGELGETVLGTPAIADGALFLRSDRHLWRYGKS